MDNRITKKRLSNFLAYEWIAIIIVAVVAVILMELFFTFASVRLTKGQRFTYFYDEFVSGDSDNDFYTVIDEEDSFSFDIREVVGEKLSKEASTLVTRVTTGEANVIFTDTVKRTNSTGQTSRVNRIIDQFDGFTFGDETDDKSAVRAVSEYLSRFLADDKQDKSPLDYGNLSEQKIAANFNERATARIYRNDLKAGIVSVNDEYERIRKLCEDTVYFKKIIEYNQTLADDAKIFYSYKRYSETVENGGNKPSGYDEDTERYYGLNLSRIGPKAKNVFYLTDSEETGDVIAVLFNLGDVYGDLKFEFISFIDAIIKNYSNFADALS
ncbi:MAG: hypothetical protein SPL13_01760 [Clostridia bacterium]|nr:hypothetical protein [Clostridia bacterium]